MQASTGRRRLRRPRPQASLKFPKIVVLGRRGRGSSRPADPWFDARPSSPNNYLYTPANAYSLNLC